MKIVKAIIKSIIASLWFWIVVVIALLVFFLYIWGFRITYDPKLETSWNAVGAIGQWAGALVGFLIPIAAIYIQANLEKNKRDIGESNSELYKEFMELKLEYTDRMKALSRFDHEDINITSEGGAASSSREELKEKALKFVNISMYTKTNQVAQHLKLSDKEAFDILEEMVRLDESISCDGKLKKENMKKIVWAKKSKC